jgi:hypothetical protein
MIQELEQVVLTVDLLEHGLKLGDVGTWARSCWSMALRGMR